MITDDFGFLGQIQDDGTIEGGDAVNWTAHWRYLTNSPQSLRSFEVGFGAYVRHPYPRRTYNGFGSYYKHPWDGVISRDQLTGILGYLIASKDRFAILRIIIHHAAWLFLFSYNTRINGQDPSKSRWKWPDITFMDIWAMELRGLLGWWSLPLTTIFDLQMLFAATIQCVSQKVDSDPISAAMKWTISREFYPSPTSWLTWNVLDKAKLISDVHAYWGGWRKQPEMGALYERKVRLLI